jgi:putative restriction endonuclease
MGAPLDDIGARLRGAAFAYLDEIKRRSGGFVTWRDLQAFTFDGRRIPLITQRGIRTISGLAGAISIFTTYSPDPERRPYDDELGVDDFPRYKWRGDDPDHYDNVALRHSMGAGHDLIWFVGVARGVYEARYPVWLVAEEPTEQQFVVALDEDLRTWRPGLEHDPHAPIRRLAERIVQVRLHQPVFRKRVLVAYEQTCALCRLRQLPLLDAAHIRPERRGGEPIVPNGIAMCAIHHRAFDANILGVDPRFRIYIRSDVLTELDGPTLEHALQGLHGGVLTLPRRLAERPRMDLLEERFEEFRAAG